MQQLCEKGVRKRERNNYANTQVSGEGGGGDASGNRAEILLQLVVKCPDEVLEPGVIDYLVKQLLRMSNILLS